MAKKHLLLFLLTLPVSQLIKPSIIEELDKKIRAAQNQGNKTDWSYWANCFCIGVFTAKNKKLTSLNANTTYIKCLTQIKNSMIRKEADTVEALIQFRNEVIEQKFLEKKEILSFDEYCAYRCYLKGLKKGFEAVDKTVCSILLDNTL